MPSLSCHIAVGINPGDDHTDQGCLATAARALHAIPAIVAAESGEHTLASIAPFSGGDAFTVKPQTSTQIPKANAPQLDSRIKRNDTLNG